MKIDPTQYNVNIRDLSEGMIQSVDGAIIPKNSVYLSMNLVFDKVIGRATVRDGLTKVNAQITDNKSILGLYQFRTPAGVKETLAVLNAADNLTSVLYRDVTGTWTSKKTGLTASAKMHFETFLSTVVGVNGTDKISSADGETWVTTGGNLDVGNMPTSKYVIEFKDRIYCAGDSSNPDRLSFSSIAEASVISWTTGNGYIDVEPEDGGGGISGLAKVPGYLLIFKKGSLKRWDGQSTYPESMINLGAPSQEAVALGRQTVFFFNQKGVFETDGGYPRKISRRVQDVIDAIPAASLSSVSVYCDGDDVLVSIGDITLNDIVLPNAILCYNIDNQHWTLFSFPSQFTMMTKYLDSNDSEFILGGDDDGTIYKMLSGENDAGSDIHYILQTHPQEFGIRRLIKKFSKYFTLTKRIRGGSSSVRVDEEDVFHPAGPISDSVTECGGDSFEGHTFEFRISGVGKSGEQIIGIDFPDVEITQNT